MAPYYKTALNGSSAVTATEPTKSVYVFTGGPTDGSEPDGYWFELTMKEAAIREIKQQPYFT